ncbi:MAG TPA: S9 family peptidase [Terriglobales bacterium]|nr:S9 family peptidase [Terriglobales bacterium]
MRRLILVAMVMIASFGFAQQAKRAFTFEDMMALKRVGEPVPSPDGKWVAFSAVDVNLEANTRTPHIWVVPLAGGEAKQLFAGGPGEDRPRWSPDGKRLAFLSSRDGGQQVWVAEFDSAAGTMGEPKKVTNLSTEVDGQIWSPDGKYILFTSQVWPECKEDACNKKKDEERANSKVKASVFTRLFYRHWSTYFSGKRTHIFIAAADGSGAVDMTPGDHDAPPFSLGGQDMYAFSPDSQEIAFTSNIDEVEAASTNNEIFVVPVKGGTPKKISVSPGSDSTPLYSPDGKYIAWRMQERAGYESDRFRLVLYERATGKITNLTENFDRWVGSFVWAPDGKRLYFSAENKGEAPIYSVDVADGRIWERERGHNDDLAITRDGRTLLLTRMSAQVPNELFVLDLNTSISAVEGRSTITENDLRDAKELGINPPSGAKVATKLTHLNDAVLSQIAMNPIESFWFKGSEKAQVQGFIVKPPNFDQTKKYPVKFLIHGGPQGAWGDSWTYRWNAQLFAANGYVVVMINPRGSTGYGQKFIDDVNGDWGGRAYKDLMLGLDYVAKTYPWADTNNACAMGASYGGYMANWIAGNTTRFKCIVSHDGMFNTESAYGTTEEMWFNEWEFKGKPWTNRELYRKWSPHLKVTNFKTPMLVVHGQLDYRLDVSEGFQLFTTLQRLRVPSKMLYFPDEGHWVLKPQNSQLWYKTVNDWVDQWTKGGKQ